MKVFTLSFLHRFCSMHKIQLSSITLTFRAIEPREVIDLGEPVREQIALMDEYDLSATWLLPPEKAQIIPV